MAARLLVAPHAPARSNHFLISSSVRMVCSMPVVLVTTALTSGLLSRLTASLMVSLPSCARAGVAAGDRVMHALRAVH